jgi:hypothetical protein
MAKVNVGTNWIRDLWYDPCDPDPWIIVELAFPALIQAIFEYVQWDWEDYVEVGTGKPWQKHFKQKIKANKWQPPKAISRGVLFLFVIESSIQRIAWMFLVAEIIANAFIRWSSLIYSLPACNAEAKRDWGRSETPLDGRPFNYDWQDGSSWVTEAGTMFPYIYPDFTVPAGGAATYATFQRYANFITGEELIVKTRIIRVRDGYPIDEAPPNDPSSKENRSSAMAGRIKNTSDQAEEYRFQVQLQGGQFPLVWACIGDFVSVSIYDPDTNPESLILPYIPLPQPDRRHSSRRGRRGGSS